MPRRSLEERRLLKKLNIPNWRHLGAEQVMEFASSIRYVDREVAKAILAQVPNFTEVSLNMIKTYKEFLDDALKSDAETSRILFHSCASMMDAISANLQKPDLSIEEKNKLIDRQVELIGMMRAIDQDNKKFKLKLAAIFGSAITACALAIAAVLGVSSKIGNENFLDDDSDDAIDVDYEDIYDDI